MTPIREQRSQFAMTALLVVLFPLIVLLAILALLLFAGYRLLLNALVRLLWLPRGKDVLLVYSDSPIWAEYMTKEILPVVTNRAKVLNWSERKRWPSWSLPVRVFHTYSGSRDFNPMLIVFRPFGKAVFFRFYPAFQEFKHGNPASLEQMHQALIAQLKPSGSSNTEDAGVL